MKILIAGGGTGGHIFPAISIAEEFIERDNMNKILFVGTRTGLEKELISQKGYEAKYISSRALIGKTKLEQIKNFFLVSKGILDSLKILTEFKPQITIGVGGYASGPMVLASSLLRIPTAICEQNSVPGITNRILSKFCNRIFATFEQSTEFFPSKKTMVFGNPLRKEILDKIQNKPNIAKDLTTVLVLGGSQGAHRLNASVPEAINLINSNDIFVIHQTGKNDYDYVKECYQRYEIKSEISEFIEDIASAYIRADLVIARSGAGTIAEISALGKPSILIPYPHAAFNHQFENAKILERAGAGIVVEDKFANPQTLKNKLLEIVDKETLERMSLASKRLGKPEASKKIVDEIYSLTKK